MKVYVLGNEQRPGVAAEVERWMPMLRAKTEVLLVDLCQEQDMSTCPGADLAQVALGAGYADQAHMSHEVRRLAGATPAALRAPA